jgi:hypothetical protein
VDADGSRRGDDIINVFSARTLTLWLAFYHRPRASSHRPRFNVMRIIAGDLLSLCAIARIRS